MTDKHAALNDNNGSNVGKSKAKRLGQVITYAGTILTLLLPCGYLLGYYNRAGYLETYGVPPGMFPVSVQDILLRTYDFSVNPMIKILIPYFKHLWFFPLFGLFFSLLAFVVVICIHNNEKLVGILNKMPKVKVRKKSKDYLLITGSVFVLGTFTPFITLLLFSSIIVFPFQAYFAGEQIAQEEQAKYVSCDIEISEKRQCARLYDSKGNIVAEGLVVAASNTTIALYQNGTTEIRPLTGLVVKIMSSAKAEKPDKTESKPNN